MTEVSGTDPATAGTLDELRGEIDSIDEELIAIIGRREAVVRRIMLLKNDEEAVRSPQRVQAVLDRVAETARRQGVDPEVVTRTYEAMIRALTELQMHHLNTRQCDGHSQAPS